MPYMHIQTNQACTDVDSLLKKASQTVTAVSGKPESYVMIALSADTPMSMGGSTAPAALIDYHALGLPDTTALSDALCRLMADEFGIAGDRVYIAMTDSPRQNWGWNHSTF